MPNAWSVPTHHLPVNQEDAPVAYGWHLGKRYKIGYISLAKHIGLVRQEHYVRTQRRHFVQRHARIASVPFCIALACRLRLVPEVCGQWKAALTVCKNVIATADPQ